MHLLHVPAKENRSEYLGPVKCILVSYSTRTKFLIIDCDEPNDSVFIDDKDSASASDF